MKIDLPWTSIFLCSTSAFNVYSVATVWLRFICALRVSVNFWTDLAFESLKLLDSSSSLFAWLCIILCLLLRPHAINNFCVVWLLTWVSSTLSTLGVFVNWNLRILKKACLGLHLYKELAILLRSSRCRLQFISRILAYQILLPWDRLRENSACWMPPKDFELTLGPCWSIILWDLGSLIWSDKSATFSVFCFYVGYLCLFIRPWYPSKKTGFKIKRIN